MITINKFSDSYYADCVDKYVDISDGDFLLETESVLDEMKLDWLKENINKVTLEQPESLTK